MIQSQLSSMESQIKTAMTTKEIGGLMGISAETLAAVNEGMDIRSITNMAKEFSKESAKLEHTTDMMGEAMEMAGDSTLDENADDIYNQVLEEQALTINNDGIAVPKSQVEE